MKIVGRNTVADNLAQNARLASLSALQILKGKNGRTFPKHHSGTISIKWPAFFRRGGLQGIKTKQHEFRKRVITAGQDALVFAGMNTFECVSDRVRAGSARVGKNLAWAANAERFLSVNYRLLRWIIGNPARRAPQIIMRL